MPIASVLMTASIVNSPSKAWLISSSPACSFSGWSVRTVPKTATLASTQATKKLSK